MHGKLPISFYQRSDTVAVARELLGKVLCSCIDGQLTTGRIVETEAYLGVEDRACHAYGDRNTDRTSVMYHSGGLAYVYLVYGIHHLFNVVTHSEGYPHAVLVRGLEPLHGSDVMLKRRGLQRLERRLTAGPGSLSKAMGIRRHHTAESLLGDLIWIEDDGYAVAETEIIATPRVGVDYAGPHALWPMRFRISKSLWTSPAK